MSFTVFLGNLPAWVTADDIRGWLAAENLVADAIKVIRNPETQESKGFAFIESPNTDEMNAIIRRFDRAPLEDRLLRANPAQPPKPKGQVRLTGGPGSASGHGGGNAGPQSGPQTGPPSGPPSSTHAGPETNPQAKPPVNPHAGPQVNPHANPQPNVDQRPPRRGKRSAGKKPNGSGGPNSAFAEELAKAL
jgi:RNA recognition motif-containing protein